MVKQHEAIETRTHHNYEICTTHAVFKSVANNGEMERQRYTIPTSKNNYKKVFKKNVKQFQKYFESFFYF